MNHENADARRLSDDPVAPDERQEEETVNGLREAEPPSGNREGEGEESTGSSSPRQLLAPPNYGMEWPQQDLSGPFPLYFPAPRPAVPHPVPNVFPNAAAAFLQDFPYFYPYFYNVPAPPHVFHLSYPYATPPYHLTFPYVATSFPFAFHYPFPPAYPNAPHLYADLSGYPYAVSYAAPHAYLDGVVEQLLHQQRGPDGYYDEMEEEDGMEVPEFNANSFVGLVENIGPLWAEDLFEEFSFSGFFSSSPGDTDSPSTSGLSSFTSRRRERSNEEEEEAAKKPRWTNESDSD